MLESKMVYVVGNRLVGRDFEMENTVSDDAVIRKMSRNALNK
jgi:hypothetical protein